jgi:methyl-accepting chemotaxis protein
MGSRGAQESQDPTPASLQFACKEALDSCFIFQETALRVLNDRFALRIQAAQRELRWTLGGSLGATLLAFYLLAGLYDSLKDGLKAMESSLAALAKGDLGRPAQVESKDEIGQLATHLNLTLASLGQMVSHIQESAQAIEKTSGDIAQSSEDLAQRTQTQAATLEETTTSLQQLSAMAVRTGQSAQNAGGDAQRMDQLVAGCGSAVHQMADIIRNIDGASSRVVDITSVVDAIAFKANLLAVNAVVRAAAGQPEEGFSMLASEVHGLGKRSADASREIKTLTQESLALIQAGSTQALQTDEAVKRITQELRQIVDFISQISAAAGEQSLGITQISQAMDELERTTLSNAGLVHQTNAAASDLAGQAMLLTSLTARFKAPA